MPKRRTRNLSNNNRIVMTVMVGWFPHRVSANYTTKSAFLKAPFIATNGMCQQEVAGARLTLPRLRNQCKQRFGYGVVIP
jgi:hypothetical protein